MGLVTLADMKTRLGIGDTSYDAFLTEQIDMLSEVIESYCRRKFEQTTWTQLFYKSDFAEGYKNTDLYLYNFPTISITSVNEYDPDTATEITSDEYRLQSTKGLLKRLDSSGNLQSWLDGYDYSSYVEVVYDAGYATVPTPVQEVIYALVEERYNKKVNGVNINFGNDVQRISIPGTISVDFDYSLQANESKNVFGMFLGNYTNVLNYYRSERALVGEIRLNYVSS